MFFSPHLQAPSVPGASRCEFIFESQDVVQLTDDYLGKKRYRFNKWQPINEGFPILHSDGLMFETNQDVSFLGMASQFTIDPADTGEVEIIIGPQQLLKYDSTKNQTEVGVGFLKYTESWWGSAQACDLCLRRQEGYQNTRLVATTLYNNEIPTSISTFNPANYAKYVLRHSPTTLIIEYTEMDSTGATISFYTISVPADHDPDHPYRILFYTYSNKDCVMRVPVRRTKINFPMSVIAGREHIYFLENPSSYVPPIAGLRDAGSHIYHQYHKAFVEDAVIRVSNSYASNGWWNTLKFLVDASLESFIYTDIDGMQFRCVFDTLKANTGIRTRQRGPGYELTMPVMVIH